jgi:hypothetical protein
MRQMLKRRLEGISSESEFKPVMYFIGLESKVEIEPNPARPSLQNAPARVEKSPSRIVTALPTCGVG